MFGSRRKPNYDGVIEQLLAFAESSELTLDEHQQVANTVKTYSQAKVAGKGRPVWKDICDVAVPTLGSLALGAMIICAEDHNIHPHSKALAWLKPPKGR